MHNNILETIVEIGLPYIISLLEIMGIIVVSWSGISAFWEYIKDMITHKKLNFMYSFSEGLAAGLEFKMAAEILKTVLVREMKELVILGAIIILRALVTILLKFEIRSKEAKNNIISKNKNILEETQE